MRQTLMKILDCPAQTRRIEVECVRFDIHQYGPGAEVVDDLCRRRKRVRGRRHEIAGADANRLERQMHRGGARVDGNRVVRTDVAGEFGLEPVGLGARGEPARVKHLFDFLQLRVAEIWQRERERCRSTTHVVRLASAASAGGTDRRRGALGPLPLHQRLQVARARARALSGMLLVLVSIETTHTLLKSAAVGGRQKRGAPPTRRNVNGFALKVVEAAPALRALVARDPQEVQNSGE